MEFLPVEGFPQVNSIPLCAYQEELKAWTLVSGSEADRQALANAGLFRFAQKAPEPRPLDDLLVELQLVGEALIESHAKSTWDEAVVETSRIRELITALDEAFEVAVGSTSPQPLTLKLHLPEPDSSVAEPEGESTLEIPEFDDELQHKMLANLANNGMTLADLAG